MVREVRINSGEELKVVTTKQAKINRPFDAIATNPNDKNFSCIYDVLSELNTTSLKLFCMLAKRRDSKTNEAALERKDLSKSEQTIVNKGYKQLETLNLVIRSRSETYMFNPEYLIPQPKHKDDIEKKYAKCRRSL